MARLRRRLRGVLGRRARRAARHRRRASRGARPAAPAVRAALGPCRDAARADRDRRDAPRCGPRAVRLRVGPARAAALRASDRGAPALPGRRTGTAPPTPRPAAAAADATDRDAVLVSTDNYRATVGSWQSNSPPGTLPEPRRPRRSPPCGSPLAKHTSRSRTTHAGTGDTTEIATLRGASGDDLLMLGMWADAVRQRGSKSVALIPYLPGARQDRGLPFGAKVYADVINGFGIDQVDRLRPALAGHRRAGRQPDRRHERTGRP